jgi:cAMP phosphodiesterase
VMVETSFPNGLKAVAESSGHMTPWMLRRELKKLRRKGIPILLAHMKPQYLGVLKKEVRQISYPKISFLRQGVHYRF